MPDKVNAPAVSQLAGEIAGKLRKASSGTKLINIETAANVISAALSEREEKVAELESAAEEALEAQRRGNSFVQDQAMDKLRAALSALGESK